MRRWVFTVTVFIPFCIFWVGVLLPMSEVMAQGIVPACPVGQEGCNNAYHPDNYGTCEVVQLLNNGLQFLVGLIAVIAAIVIVYAGFQLVVSQGNSAKITAAKSLFINVLIGFVIVLSAFLIINTIMKVLVGDTSAILNWQQIDTTCKYANTAGDPKYGIKTQNYDLHGYEVQEDYYHESVTVVGNMPSGYQGGGGSGGGYNGGGNLIPASGSCKSSGLKVGDKCYAPNRCLISVDRGACTRISAFNSHIEAAAKRYNIPANRIRGVMITESGGNPNARSPVGAIGLMQIMPATGGASCGYSASELYDPAKNIDCGARYYANQFNKFGTHDLAAAAYNAGPGRNVPSRDCPGLLVWQCPFNSGGCCSNNQVTSMSCRLNTGFNETRAYVDKVNSASPACRI